MNKARLECAVGQYSYALGNLDDALYYLNRAIAALRSLDDRRELAQALYNLGATKYGLGYYQESLDALMESYQLYTTNAEFVDAIPAVRLIWADLRGLGRDQEAARFVRDFTNTIRWDDLEPGLQLAIAAGIVYELPLLDEPLQTQILKTLEDHSDTLQSQDPFLWTYIQVGLASYRAGRGEYKAAEERLEREFR